MKTSPEPMPTFFETDFPRVDYEIPSANLLRPGADFTLSHWPPLPSGERIPVNTVPHSQTVNRSRLADEPPSLDPFEKPAVAPVVVPLADSLPPDAASESAPVVLQAAPAENLSPSPDDQSAKE